MPSATNISARLYISGKTLNTSGTADTITFSRDKWLINQESTTSTPFRTGTIIVFGFPNETESPIGVLPFAIFKLPDTKP